MNLFSDESGIVSFFMSSGGDPIVIYREDCDAGWDRETGRYINSRKIKIEACALVRPSKQRQIVQDDGGERARGKMMVQTKEPLYTSDERDNASADIILAKGSYWKVMSVDAYCSYYEAEIELLPDDVCKDLGLLNDEVS